MRPIRTLMTAFGIILIITAFMFTPQKQLKETPGETGFAVLELYTSEGCSSCPAADQLMAQVREEYKDQPVYVLAFHVDYWDRQGWRDRFSNPEFSKRQRQYARWLNLPTLYTPQLVVNGSEEYVGSDKAAITQSIATALERKHAETLTLTATVKGGQIDIDYHSTDEDMDAELVLALVEPSAQTRVGAGENSGRKLSHVQIVRGFIRVPVGITNNKNVAMDLPVDLHNKPSEIIGFVQHRSNGAITAAVRLRL